MKDVELITLRQLIVAARRRGERVKDIARMFDVSRGSFEVVSGENSRVLLTTKIYHLT